MKKCNKDKKVKGCSETLERYSRVTGFYSATGTWNPGKKAELKDRKMYKIDKLKKEKKDDK